MQTNNLKSKLKNFKIFREIEIEIEIDRERGGRGSVITSRISISEEAETTVFN